MSENKITFPAKLASNNPQSFGIVDAMEVSGHRSVDTLSDLYSISDQVLSILKDGSDAIGQEWFVVSEDCKYRLDNWVNRKSIAGWTKLPKQELINTKQSVSEKDQPNGYAGLDSIGKIPIEKTYGFTATVVDVATYEELPATGLDGVIYNVLNTGAQYKWSGSAYIDITDGADNAKKNETSIFDCSNGTSTKYYSSLLDAINVVPPVYRTSNRIISYLSTENDTTSAVNYQYHGIDSTTWTDLTKWEHIPNQADLAEIRSDLNEIITAGVYVENPEYVYVMTDDEGKILLAIKTDGSIYYGTGVPQQVVDYINNRIAELSLDEYEDIVVFLNNLEKGDKNLQILLNEKVDKEEGKSLIDAEYASTTSTVDNPEFLDVTLDAEDKILEGIQADGTKVIGGNLKVFGNMEVSGVSYKIIENPEYLAAWVDVEDKIIFGIRTDGKTYVGDANFLKDIDDIKAFLHNITDKNIDWDAFSTIAIIENPEYIEAKTDSEGKLLAGRTNDGAAFENIGFSTPKVSIEGHTIENIEDLEGRSEITTDSAGKIISYRDKYGVKHEEAGIEAPNIPDIHTIEEAKRSIYNYDQECNIYSAARYYQYSGEGDFQATLITDTHGNNTCIERAIDITNRIKSIKCFIHLGDIVGYAPFDRYVNQYDIEGGGFYRLINGILPKTCDKPWFIVPGNHEIGVTPYISFTRTDEEVYNDLIKPMIDNGILIEGEYNTEGDYADKCYYFHDFHSNKVRIIVLYEYGWKQEVDVNQYWEPVSYDSSVGQIEQCTTYTYDESNPIILNCHNFKEFSFRLKKTVTTLGASTNVLSDTMPRFKCIKGYQIFTKKQLEWLAGTLNSTPNGYGVIILSHQALMENVNVPNYKFSCNSNTAFSGYNPRGSGRSYDQLTDNLVISKIVDAWKNKSILTERVAAVPGYTLDEIGDPTYLNVLEDIGYKYMYDLSLDFSSRTNDNAYFSCFINGHEHVDTIEQSKAYPYQLSIMPTCGNPPFRDGKDIASVSEINSKAYDCITVFTEKDKERIVLCKYGNMRTTGGDKRDFEIINPYNV